MAYSPPIAPKFRANVSGYSAETARYWLGSSARWGAVAGLAGLFLVSQVPIIKQQVLQKMPFIGGYWKVEDAKN
ncbi:hypothetical protein IWW55_002478 [Coemansia sp. RSA 2706]|nr:hypothetical protein IWW55_002478 [Coemansia sp. RSA 2706]KAJ2311513.1 hypothetical protein IWW54_002600 [Coemansia sp. RSA 2705]KAJ2318208.1 hypothetical protein IWW52_002689 [Coemansia sp. RSA 2704]KAJ2319748.1 hypothetical protein IWW51_004790 [Coemansia sp. RSA 2702]KAJ2365699.1 hypothetical protein H4S01_003102 [Coemansia sp. RSA 2610]KAJ2389949.1 hypothetical protein H4S02_002113 [Coemansia sp. RSA 2611]KAJ2730361.1 hypothetical protein H4R23_003351 [Coemansia sp. Cherry 401B]